MKTMSIDELVIIRSIGLISKLRLKAYKYIFLLLIVKRALKTKINLECIKIRDDKNINVHE